MPVNKRKSRRSLGSDLPRVDAHVIQPEEYDALPELTDEMLSRAIVKKAGRPVLADPRKPISLRLPLATLDRWKASGPGWQTRMVQELTRRAPMTAA